MRRLCSRADRRPIAGTLLAHLIFGEPLLQAATHIRTRLCVWTGELVATFALLPTILGCLRAQPAAVPYAVGLIITAGYWFISSTSFANPAVTIARSLTNSFAGIRPVDAPGFILAQIAGALAATAITLWLWPARNREARNAVRETVR